MINDSLEIDETAEYIEKFINDTTEKAKDDPNLFSMEFMNLIFDLRYKLYELSLISGTKYDLAINEKEFVNRLKYFQKGGLLWQTTNLTE